MFKTLVTENLPNKFPLKSETDIENAVFLFNTTIQEASWDSTPNFASNHPNKNQNPILDQIMAKRRLRRRWQLTRDPHIKTALNKADKEV